MSQENLVNPLNPANTQKFLLENLEVRKISSNFASHLRNKCNTERKFG